MNKVKELRLSKGLQQKEMAKELGMSSANYSKKESGKIRWSLEEAKQISDFFRMTIAQVFFDN